MFLFRCAPNKPTHLHLQSFLSVYMPPYPKALHIFYTSWMLWYGLCILNCLKLDAETFDIRRCMQKLLWIRSEYRLQMPADTSSWRWSRGQKLHPRIDRPLYLIWQARKLAYDKKTTYRSFSGVKFLAVPLSSDNLLWQYRKKNSWSRIFNCGPIRG